MNAITLFELNNQVKQTLKKGFAETVWITAEITELQQNHSGHCYLQLADKKEEDATILATARGTIWAFTFRTLRPYFETTTGRSLAKGMKVMLNVEVVFHEVYGYSLNIRDIDPTYTLGDLEQKKREILMQLEKDGIIDMNRELEFPILPKNIAVISSPTAAGLGDFMNQIEHNSSHFRFHVKLFPAIMQGEKTTESVIAALDRIYEYESIFDVVVIIRGGGSQTDLGWFDSYDIAANIAQFPIPVISGIGHERDETIADRVAHVRVKTPTAAATFLIELFAQQKMHIESLQADMVTGVQELLYEQKTHQLLLATEFKRVVTALLTGDDNRLKLLSKRMEHASTLYTRHCLNHLATLKGRMDSRTTLLFERLHNVLNTKGGEVKQRAARVLDDHRRRLELAATTVKYADPKKVLERGYSITRLNGKAVKQADTLKVGDILETEMVAGKIRSEVKTIDN